MACGGKKPCSQQRQEAEDPLTMTQRIRTTLISLIGAPGSGKGTYGSMMASRIHNCTLLSVGDVLREHSVHNTSMKQVLQSGTLVDDGLVSDAVLQHLRKHTAQENSIIILDGFPRNQEQTQILSTWPKKLQHMMALHFDVPDDVCITKLLGRRKCSICKGSYNVNGVHTNGFNMPPILPNVGSCQRKCNRESNWEKRDDDTEETIRKRMNVYHEQTEPVLKYWLEQGKLVRFVPYNGVCDIDAICDKVKIALHDMNQVELQ